MDIQKELLLAVRTSLDIKGPYKIQIIKNDQVITTLKIRMKDDVTHIVQLSQGDYVVRVLNNDKDYLIHNFALPNFENGSQLKLNISDTAVEVDFSGLIKYISLDDFVDMLEEDSKKKGPKKANKLKPATTSAKQKLADPIYHPSSSRPEKSKNVKHVEHERPKVDSHDKHKPEEKAHKETHHDQKGCKSTTIDLAEEDNFKIEVNNKIKELFQIIETLQKDVQFLKEENTSLKEKLNS